MSCEATSKRPSRAARVQDAIITATRELLAEGGVSGLTIEGVAERAGVAKTTIYRRWSDKDELALAVLIDTTEGIRTPPDVGDTRKELLTFVATATQVIQENGAFAGLASEIATRPELARVYRERVVDLRLAEVGEVVARGVQRGDLREDTDARLLHATAVVDAVLAAFRPAA
jgi:AcrR family transcriptional regulator